MKQPNGKIIKIDICLNRSDNTRSLSPAPLLLYVQLHFVCSTNGMQYAWLKRLNPRRKKKGGTPNAIALPLSHSIPQNMEFSNGNKKIDWKKIVNWLYISANGQRSKIVQSTENDSRRFSLWYFPHHSIDFTIRNKSSISRYRFHTILITQRESSHHLSLSVCV